MATGLPSQEQVIELLDDEFARAGYEIEGVVIAENVRPPRIIVTADGDKPLDLDTLAGLSRSASTLLDSVDGGAGEYVLEVTSPGVERPLTTERHFRRAHGRKADVTLADGSRVTGRIGAVSDGAVALVVREGRELVVRELPVDSIAEAVVQVEFSSPSARELELIDGETG